ncbi:MAG: sigma-E processing peptidase SpoIIGA [Christensenellales bacterium]
MVYIEVVLLNNLFVNLFIAYLTCIATNKPCKKLRVFFAALFGAILAVIYPLVGKYKYIIAVLLSPIMVLIFFPFKRFKEYVLGLLVFMAITFSLGGSTIGFSNLFGIELTKSIIYGLTFLGCLFIAYVLKQLIKSRILRKRIIKVTLYVGGEKFEINGLLDTGNSLCDSKTAMPVIVISKKIGEKLTVLPERQIAVKTVGGTSTLKLISAEKIELHSGKKGRCVKNFLVAVSKENYHGYDVVLHNSFCQEAL